MSISRDLLTNNYRNTILDPLLNRAPDSKLPFKCGDCGLMFSNYKSKIVHQANYCLKQNKDLSVEKETMRIRSLDYLHHKHLPPVLPIDGKYIPPTKYTQPYNYDRLFKKYDHLKNPAHRYKNYEMYLEMEHGRPVLSAVLDPHRVFFLIEYFKHENENVRLEWHLLLEMFWKFLIHPIFV
jgi:hypothetical protein